MAVVFLSLGSNQGDRLQYLHKAIRSLRESGVKIGKISTIIETDPIGGPPQEKYLNAVLKAEVSLSPDELLDVTLSVEHSLGRVRKILNGPRVIDIDILLYDNFKIISKRLVIPHPRMLDREFVINPLKEIEPTVLF